MNSTRLPGKVLKEINGLPLIVHIYRRLLACRELDEVKVLPSSSSWEVNDLCVNYGINVRMPFTKDDENLIQRYLDGWRMGPFDAFIRITADCLFHDPQLIDNMVATYRNRYPKVRGLTNRYPTRTISEGLDAEIYSAELLAELDRTPDCPRENFAVYAEEKGLLTPYQPRATPLGADLHLSIDTQSDLDRAEKMLKHMGSNDIWGYEETLKAYYATA